MKTTHSAPPAPPPEARQARANGSPAALLRRYQEVRAFSVALTDGLPPEDFVVQSMTDVSPLKWHLAHTTWFFEAFILMEHRAGHTPLDPRYHYLFNSYYTQAGERHCRDQRGYLSRPTVAEVMAYRGHVDEAMEEWLGTEPGEPRVWELLELGLNHEQQHQELMLTDIKHVFSVNPLRPAFRSREPKRSTDCAPPAFCWIDFPEGVHEVGWGETGFSYDNEGPRHRVFLQPFSLAHRPVTCGEFLQFIEDGGYRRPELWMSDGWGLVEEGGWTEPFYWEQRDGEWWLFTLSGMRPIDPREPVCHVNWYEADAFARWAGARLPTEAEWEVAAAGRPIEGNLVESGRYHPAPVEETGPAEASPLGGSGLERLFGDVWEWTGSAYRPYPGFRPAPGAVGEYNGKFMSNQFVLRGGSCATSSSHIRPTYRNFFHPDASWQFSGIRLAKDPG